MIYYSHIENGVVIFLKPVRLPDGTTLRVEAVGRPEEDFWESCSLDDLARRQAVSVPRSTDELLGGWPDDELEDRFDTAVRAWRDNELERSP